MKQATLTIEKLACGGAGVGRHDGKIWFVPYTAPGETVLAEAQQEKRSYVNAALKEVIVPSTNRTVPPCPVFAICGGCNFQHLDYSAQVLAKEDIFRDMLIRATGVERENILPAIPAPNPTGYRTRLQLKIRAVNGKVTIGFYRTGTHFVVDLPEKCLVAAPTLNKILPALRELLETFPQRDMIPQVDAATGYGNAISLIFHCLDNADKSLETLLRECKNLLDGASLFIQSGRKQSIRKICGTDRLCYTLPDVFDSPVPKTELCFSRGGFSQINTRVNSLILAELHRWLDLKGTERLLDLFCGNGNFSLPLAPLTSEIVGVEEYAPSIEDAIFNMEKNRINNARFLIDRADRYIERIIKKDEHFDIAILDPPRQGALETIKKLVQLGTSRIFYISCDPATLARDASFLKHAGYELINSRVFDMFPQTHHIESLTYFIKTK